MPKSIKTTLKGLLLLLMLVTPAAAQRRPFESSEHHFRAVFPGPVKVVRPRPDQITYGRAPSDASRDWQAVSVLVGHLRKKPRDALNYLVSEGVVKPHAGPVSDIRLGTLAGIEVLGMDDQGCPFGLRIFTTAEETYVVMSRSMDIPVNKAFLQSFELTRSSSPAKSPRK